MFLRGVKTRLTSVPEPHNAMLVTRRETHCLQLRPERNFGLYEKAIDGAGDEELVLEAETAKYC